MSRPEGFDPSGYPDVNAREPRPPLFRVMIGCGVVGVLIAIGAAVVDFGTGRHSLPANGPGSRSVYLLTDVPGGYSVATS
ncbi:MAG TPA: hypothetical protein VGL21_02650 [Jatrophihabitantaceae bacterium]|jgi:hypothetical protein